MKKLMPLMLGLALTFGTVATVSTAFAQEKKEDSKDKKASKKKGGKKKDDAPKKEGK